MRSCRPPEGASHERARPPGRRGPGDPELLTLKAVKVLARADVVLCDDLVGEGVLDYVRPGARVVHVGKRGGCRSTPQVFIERLMIAEARKGHAVVRLKGGDPFVFGRGGEECEALRAAGIPFEIVSGITAGVAAAPRCASRSPIARSATERSSSPATASRAAPTGARSPPPDCRS
jgi:uroporphyrin-III C-methyltransferase